MAVRDALLVLLLDGPAYGFQLHGGLAARTGGRRDINVGQTYATLDRLARQRLVERAGTTDDGLPLHRLTAAGREAAAAWLAGADAAGADAWHETLDRVMLAASLPSIDASPVIGGERERWGARRADAVRRANRAAAASGPGAPRASGPEALAALAATADIAQADAAIAWLDGASRADDAGLAFAPSTDRPRRGRRPSQPPSQPQSIDA
ncbi:PadR family transcriptional regulator [Agromyces aurantiacus]|uniref:PadR family transcriptional regulator n=1 Tax=Agromyces aurantiacus TaxID=165814 RepID=A0ABV9RA49_9MICO|nr:helix-turn-helix transcriptional regulator [Agromyces aurantiacus]MBM7504692.1 DNA-binding PadR family transcriptional regulator [Agromyces aurantiacus]